MSELTQQQINQKRREKILARSRKLQLNTQLPSFVQPSFQKQQNAPLLQGQQQPTQGLKTPKTPNSQKRQADAFARFRELQAKAQRQKMLLILSKFLGIIIASVQLYLLSVTKNYEIKYKNNEIDQTMFNHITEKFIDEQDLIYWAIFCTIVFTWVWIKFIRSGEKVDLNEVQIIPGSTMMTLLEQLNKVLQYKVLVKALLGYTFTCIITHLVLNQLIVLLGYQDSFYKPNLAQILKSSVQTLQNQQIL